MISMSLGDIDNQSGAFISMAFGYTDQLLVVMFRTHITQRYPKDVRVGSRLSLEAKNYLDKFV
jgi:hypothetical protein